MTSDRDPRRAFRVVDDFEAELCDYTGAPRAVALDSCTNALFLALTYERERLYRPASDPLMPTLALPRRTYVGVLQAALNAGWPIRWTDEEWQPHGMYSIPPTRIIDSARRLHRDVWRAACAAVRTAVSADRTAPVVCLSFHASKQLPLGRGGAILTADDELDDWLRRVRSDGRPEGRSVVGDVTLPGWHCFMPPPTAALGLWQLTTLEDMPHPKELYVDPDLSEL